MEVTIKTAEKYERKAQTEQHSGMIAGHWREGAIRVYKTIPKCRRKRYDIDKRIENLYKKLEEDKAKLSDEMHTIEGPTLYIDEEVEAAENAVRGKELPAALNSLAHIYLGAKFTEIREGALNLSKESLISSLCLSKHIADDGRTVAKKHSASSSSDGDNDEYAVESNMIQLYTINLEIVAESRIRPALEIIIQEHQILEEDFHPFVKKSPIVPPGREVLIAKGLFFGYTRDFIAASHILVPQFEHWVRFHLKNHGIKTSNTDEKGVENENSLCALIQLPKAKEIFGEDLSYEFQAFFCDPRGINMRNELAHGLLDDKKAQAQSAIYAWWLMLRIVFDGILNEEVSAKQGGHKAKD